MMASWRDTGAQSVIGRLAPRASCGARGSTGNNLAPVPRYRPNTFFDSHGALQADFRSQSIIPRGLFLTRLNIEQIGEVLDRHSRIIGRRGNIHLIGAIVTRSDVGRPANGIVCNPRGLADIRVLRTCRAMYGSGATPRISSSQSARGSMATVVYCASGGVCGPWW